MDTKSEIERSLELHPVVSREAWVEERKALLAKEKEFTYFRDRLRAERRALPWVKVEKTYIFDTPWGKKTLAELFDGRSQLFVKHFMFGPEWKEGCVGCSFEADHLGGALVHLENHDVTVVVIARAPLAKIEAFKQRMGWEFKWVSSFETDFNFDYGVSCSKEDLEKGETVYNYETIPAVHEELSGMSVFYKNAAGEVFHTYSTYGRGAEELIGTYVVLDMMPKGRNETGPNGNLTDWVRHHDRYESGGFVDGIGRYHPPTENNDAAVTEGVPV